MDGRGRALDNIFVERLWRSVKYEEVYLRDYETIPEAIKGLRRYFEFYNCERFQQSLKPDLEETISFLDHRTLPLSLENGQLLPQGKVLKRQIASFFEV